MSSVMFITVYLQESYETAMSCKCLVLHILTKQCHCTKYFKQHLLTAELQIRGAPVAQWVKHWPTVLANRVGSPLKAKSSQP